MDYIKNNIIYIRTLTDSITETISILSFLSSTIVIIVIYKKQLLKNLTNQYILQLTVSEMVNNFTHFSSIFLFFIDKSDHSNERMRVCYPQIYTGLFSNYYTLSSSLLIAYRLYDVLVKKGTFSKEKNKVRISQLVSLFGSITLSYIIWIIQMIFFQHYFIGAKQYVRLLSCWVSFDLDLFVLFTYCILIIVIFYFCCKSRSFIKEYSQLLEENDNEDEDSNKDDINSSKCSSMKKLKIFQKRLLLYPWSTLIIFSIIIIFRLIAYFANQSNNQLLVFICLLFYGFATVSRGFVFSSVYFLTQKIFREGLYELFSCKKSKNNISTLSPFQLVEE